MGCKGCSKLVLVCVNIATLISGAGLAAAGIILMVNDHQYIPEISTYNTSLDAPCGVTIFIGVLGALLGLLGCYAVYSGRTGLLNFFFYLIFALLLIEIAGVITLGVMKETTTEKIMTSVEDIFERFNEDAATEVEMAVVSSIQLAFSCCGFGGTSRYWTLWDGSNSVPSSCCGARADPHSAAYFCNRWDLDPRHDVSCREPFLEFVEISIWIIIGVFIGFILLNMWQMASARILRKWTRDEEYVYTRHENEAASSYTGKTIASDKTYDTGFNSTWL